MILEVQGVVLLFHSGFEVRLQAVEEVLHLRLTHVLVQLFHLVQLARHARISLLELIDLRFELVHIAQELGQVLLVTHDVPTLIKLLLLASLNLFVDQFLFEELFLDDDLVAFVGCNMERRIKSTSFSSGGLLFLEHLLLLGLKLPGELLQIFVFLVVDSEEFEDQWMVEKLRTPNNATEKPGE